MISSLKAPTIFVPWLGTMNGPNPLNRSSGTFSRSGEKDGMRGSVHGEPPFGFFPHALGP